MLVSAVLSLVASAPLALGAVHYVTVGGLKPDGTPNLAYTPNVVYANPGDQVHFTFMVKNHTVTQSSFDSPCSKLANSYGQPIGFDSGFNPVPANDTNFPTFQVTVNDTNPIWGYCRQINPPNPTHCQSGMVFGINPSAEKTFDAFLYKAKASTSQNTVSSSYAYQSTSSAGSWETTKTVTVTQTQTETKTITVDESSTTTYSSALSTHTITVGGDPKTVGFQYSPPNITAQVGDHVVFKFMQKNHTATQASFGDPCRPLADTSYPSVQGFDSGFNPVAPNATYFPTFEIVVNDTNPIWGYCRQQAANFSHCGVGMVFSINAKEGTDKSFEAFQHLAVTKNGSGFVDPFGNLTPAATPAPWSSYGGGSKNVENLDALGSSSGSDNDSANLKKLLDDYAPAVLGLLGGVMALVIALLVVVVMLLRRTRPESAPMRTVAPTYQQVPLTMPSSKMQEDGSHDYDEPRYTDREPAV